MFRHYFTLLLTVVSLPAFAADNPDIRELMTPEELAASGLNGLSDDQLAVINRWLERFQAGDGTNAVSTSPAGNTDTPATFRSRIDGEFSGWNGPTRFPLKNGQVWETRSTRRYSYSAVDPEVEFTRNFLGQYRMRVLETGRSIAVRLVE